MIKNLFAILCLLLISPAYAQDKLSYQTPPKAMADVINAAPTPRVSISDKGDIMLIIQTSSYPSIAELAEPELRLAGLRLNPRNNGPARLSYTKGLSLKNINTGIETAVKGLPENPLLGNISWSPDNSKIAFCQYNTDNIRLYVLDIATATARQVSNLALNITLANSGLVWLPDNQSLIVSAVPDTRSTAPVASAVPEGPVVQENLGKRSPARTYQDLLKNEYDAALFEYYTTAQLYKISLPSGQATALGEAGLIQSFAPSPDGKYLLVQQRHRPFSYLLPASSFPNRVEIWDMQGKLVKQLADIPLVENVPISFDAVRTGQRNHAWRADMPATVYWVEAQDEGNPKNEVAIRDKVFVLDAPFVAPPQELLGTKYRFQGITWGNHQYALYQEGWRANRKEIITLLNPQTKATRVLFDRSAEDTYTDPGNPLTKRNQYGRFVLDLEGSKVLMSGQGASPEGDRPFLDELDLVSKKTTRLWQSEAPYLSRPIQIIDRKKGIALISRESPTENPNYYLCEWRTKKVRQITSFAHPYPQMKNINKQVLKYKRADGVELSATLYLPAQYKKEDGALPMLMEAYPTEFKSKSAAGQVSGSPYEFVYLNWGSPVFWALQGYAVMENASIPIVGEGDKEPNDTYIEQLIAGAKAAIDEGVRLGVCDPNRVAVMGHSYGAFMTANLLAHSNLFKAGIARSGAYNRTLTPFGFQSEERTYWQAMDVYTKMSPFSYADKIKTPLLLIHGEADNNSGTFPIQGERFYNAIKGHGGTARYVLLPYESHGYRAKESILHMLWEMDTWLERYVKNTKN